MFIYDVLNKEKVYELVLTELRNFGVKRRPKKQTVKVQKFDSNNHSFKKVFKTHLAHLPLDVVKLSSGAVVHVPHFVYQACTFIEKFVSQEGLFRKAGSQLRQKEIMARLDNGGTLGDKYQVVDVANVLKTFFRDLPEPLIPCSYHDLFLRCATLKNYKVDALLMACILLPPYHLNTLAYFTEFLNKVAKQERYNKMGIDNLAKVIGPSLMPMQESTVSAMQSRLEAHLSTVKILIENAGQIGILPATMSELLASEVTGSVDNDLNCSDTVLRTKNKKKKRRSGSLTRMLNGLKKMVSKSGSPDEAVAEDPVSNQMDVAHTPSIKAGKKRKVVEPIVPLGTKKKRQVLRTMPDGGNVLGNVYTPIASIDSKAGSEKLEKTKKLRLSLDRLVSKSKQKMTESEIDVCKNLNSPHIERRWSSVSGLSWSKKKRQRDCKDLPTNLEENTRIFFEKDYDRDSIFMDADVNLSDDGAAEQVSQKLTQINYNCEPRLDDARLSDDQRSEYVANFETKDEEYVTIPKSEYEEIKSRVSAIESRISQEFGCISNDTSENLEESSASKVQSEYEKTLEEAGIGSTTTADNLAKRLSKELKIRRSIEHKIIRSPSARKIGNLRRRSQERPHGKRCTRSISWHMAKPSTVQQISEPNGRTNNFHLKSNLKRGRPNTVYTGLEQPILQGATSLDTICTDETNARLDYLQKQLHALITHTVEHTEAGTASDDIFMRTRGSATRPEGKITSTNMRRSVSVRGTSFIDNLKNFDAKMNELKTCNNQRDCTLKSSGVVGTKSTNETPAQKTVDWKDADQYFKLDNRTRTPAPQTGRASVAKLRAQNAGMVMAKAKLFDDTPKNPSTKDACRVDENARFSDSTGRQSIRMVKSRDVKGSSSEPSSTSKKGAASRRKNNSKSPKNVNGKLKLSYSAGSSPSIKMEMAITHNQRIVHTLEKSPSRHNTPKYDQTRLDISKNDLKIPSHHLNSLPTDRKNNDVELQLREIKDIISSPIEKKRTINSILRESNANILEHGESSPCKTPHIKRPLTTRTPKETKTMIRKHLIESRRTPMKAVPSASSQSSSDLRRSPKTIRKSKQFVRTAT